MKHIFKLPDIALLFSVVLFSIIAIQQTNQIYVSGFSSILALSLFLSYIDIIRQRIKNKRLLDSNYLADIEIEDELQSKNRALYNDIRSKRLEKAVRKYLEKSYNNVHIYSNINIIKSDGNTTEIDILAIINNKIFVIECKNYAVELLGDWEDEELTAKYSTPIKIKNPIKQNQYHVEQLSKLLMSDLNYYGNIIVFGEQTQYPIQQTPKNTMICKLSYLDKPIQHLKISELDSDTLTEALEILDRMEDQTNTSKELG